MKTCHPIIQLHCPYTSKLLSEIDTVNAEHILPFAFGAPQNFTVRADAIENSRMADIIDTPCTNDPLMRMLAIASGVESRSGAVVLKTTGVIQATGDEVLGAISKDGVKFKHKIPVELDASTKIPTVVKGIGDEAQLLAEGIKRKYASKGIILDLGNATTLADSTLGFSLEGDLDVLQQELIKIAYLMTVFVFGDDAILSESGELYRSGIAATNPEQLAKVGIGVNTAFAESVQFLPKQKEKTHVLTCFITEEYVISTVSLFGIFSCTYFTPTKNFTSEVFTGKVVTITPATKAINCVPYLDWLQNEDWVKNGDYLKT